MAANEIRTNRCVILCASPEFDMCPLKPDDYIIACDGGYAHALKHGIKPDFVLGDFDSYTGSIDPDIRLMRVPPEKDDTDTMLAIKLALEDGYRNFLLLGATGGRLDHELSNVGAAVYIARRGGRCEVYNRLNKMHAICNDTLELRGIRGQTVSVLSYTDNSYGVTLRGMKYPLEDFTLHSEFPLGQSNVAQDDVCSVSVRDGVLLVIEAGFEH